VELYSVIVARFVWNRYLMGRKAIAFVDNESAKEALVKGSSFNAHFKTLLLQLEIAEKDMRSWLWFSRVPSHSNPSDGPSRGDSSLMEILGAFRAVHLRTFEAVPWGFVVKSQKLGPVCKWG